VFFSLLLSFLPIILKGHLPLLFCVEVEVVAVFEVVLEVKVEKEAEAFPSTIRSSDTHLSRMGKGCISRMPLSRGGRGTGRREREIGKGREKRGRWGMEREIRNEGVKGWE
jgi:hypothetical protein